ncbi:MAG: dienelactone hydrolase family protein [Phycisphaeraceae bacterium]
MMMRVVLLMMVGLLVAGCVVVSEGVEVENVGERGAERGVEGVEVPEGMDALERLESSPRHHEWVVLGSGRGRSVRAFVVYPEVAEKAGVVVVIHENRGLNDWARSVADQVAELGYIAIAPDLLSGMGPGGGGTEAFGSPDEARTGIYGLDQAMVTEDLKAVVRYGRTMDAGDGRVSVAGFCWGGSQAFGFAAEDARLAGVYVFYGSAPEAGVMERIAVPVYGFYGGNDARITSAVPEVAQAMAAAGKRYEPVVYEGAGHGFLRAGEMAGASEANRVAREEAWVRWGRLLRGR